MSSTPAQTAPQSLKKPAAPRAPKRKNVEAPPTTNVDSEVEHVDSEVPKRKRTRNPGTGNRFVHNILASYSCRDRAIRYYLDGQKVRKRLLNELEDLKEEILELRKAEENGALTDEGLEELKEKNLNYEKKLVSFSRKEDEIETWKFMKEMSHSVIGDIQTLSQSLSLMDPNSLDYANLCKYRSFLVHSLTEVPKKKEPESPKEE